MSSARGLTRRRGLLTAAVLVLAAAAGVSYFAGGPADAPPAYATACKASNGCSADGVTYRTAAVNVRHGVQDGINITPVEPDAGETWDITAYSNTAAVPDPQTSETASATVTWSGCARQLSDVSTTTHILLGPC